jgi:hypothetical protein
MRILRSVLMLSVLAASVPLFSTGSASALPLNATAGVTILTTHLDQAQPTIQVRNNGGAVAAGVIGGMILGGIIATQAPYYYGNAPYGYYPPAPAYQPYPMGGDAVAYCMRRFRSYDPSSMTYVGYDGLRHSCP